MDFSLTNLGAKSWLAIQEWMSAHGIKSLAILLGALLALRLTRVVAHRIVEAASDHDETTNTEKERRAATISQVVNKLANMIVMLVAGLMLLRELGMDIGPILAGAGVAGLAVGFGAQSLVKDYFSGFFLLIEEQVRVGDVIQAGGQTGQVERVSLRTTVLRDTAGVLHVIPNGQISTVSNHTFGWSRAVIKIGVSYHEEMDHVFEVMRRVGAELSADPDYARYITSELQIPGVDEFAESAVMVQAFFRTEPLQQWMVAREFRRRLKKAFDVEGIEIPYPHRTLYHRVEEPLSVAVDREVKGGPAKYGWSVLPEGRDPSRG